MGFWKFSPILPEEHLSGQTLMLDEKVWLKISNSSKKCSIRFWLGTYGGQSSSFKPNSLIRVFLDDALSCGAVRKGNRNIPKLYSLTKCYFIFYFLLSVISCYISFSCHSRISVWILDTAQKSQYILAAVCFLLLISWARSGLRTKRLSSACWWR